MHARLPVSRDDLQNHQRRRRERCQPGRSIGGNQRIHMVFHLGCRLPLLRPENTDVGNTSSTTIRYGLPDRSHVTITLFNTLGQEVALLQNGEQEAGYHEVQCDGSRLSSGVYFYHLRASDFVETKRLLFVR